MKKQILTSIAIALFFTFGCTIFTTTNYKNLTDAEKRYIQSFNIDSSNKQYDYKSNNWHLQEINVENLKKLCSKSDTTIVFFYKPTCGGYDEYLKKVTEIKLLSNTKLILVSESYYLGHMIGSFMEAGFNKAAYIIDHSYGHKILSVKRNFTKSAFGFTKLQSDSSAFIWLNKNGEFIKSSSEI